MILIRMVSTPIPVEAVDYEAGIFGTRKAPYAALLVGRADVEAETPA